MHFTWYHYFAVTRPYAEYGHVIGAAIVTCLIVVISLLARFIAPKPEQALVPSRGFSLHGFFEVIVEALSDFVESVLGHDGQIYLPVIGSFFMYIFISNFLGLLPGFSPPTDNLNTTLAVGVFSFVLYNVLGVRTHGIAYLKHFLGPVLWIAPLIFVIEVLSNLIRPFSLGIRLYANMIADHMVVGAFLGLTPIFIPMIFYGLGIFVCFVQSFVFSLLSMVYISLATAHDDH